MIHMRKAKSEFELHIFALHVEFLTGLNATNLWRMDIQFQNTMIPWVGKSSFLEFQTLET